MRLKMASAVEGCLYRRLNVVPGRPSRYSKDRREDADILLLESARSPSKVLALSIHDRLILLLLQIGTRSVVIFSKKVPRKLSLSLPGVRTYRRTSSNPLCESLTILLFLQYGNAQIRAIGTTGTFRRLALG